MGNCWTGINEQRFEDYEKRMLIHSGIKFEDFQIENVIIDDKGNYVRTIQVGDRSKQTIVFMHGYGGSGIMFWKIMKQVSENYHCIFIDILGMGGSSRPKFNVKTPEEADEFLIDWLERWRQKMGDLKGFVLAGHSFGGYVAGIYACRYHKYIKKLLMLSPAGIAKRPEDFDFYEEIKKQLTTRKRKPPSRCAFNCCMACFSKVWKRRCSPFGVMRCCGKGCTTCLMKNYVKRRFASVPQNEIVDYKVYLEQTLLRGGSTEYAIFVCFDQLMFAHHALEEMDRLGGIPIPVSFFFGDFDWMYSPVGDIIVNRNPYKGSHSNVYIVENSDHHMYFDNPEDFVEKILIDLSNLEELSTLPLQRVQEESFIRIDNIQNNNHHIANQSNQALLQ